MSYKRADVLGQNSATALWNSQVVHDDFADEFLINDPDDDFP
jgi:hypothetical protein